MFGTLAQRNKVSRETILEFITSQKKAIIIYDAYIKGLRKNQKEIIENSLRAANILKVNKKEFLKLKDLIMGEKEDNKEFLHYLFEHFRLNLICVTLDKWGCYIFTKDETVYSPGINVATVDTVGAGDAFTASLIIEYLKNEPLDTIAERANYVGAYTSGYKSATPVYSKDDIISFSEKNVNKNIKQNIL
ncbi:PfkB family carbohydrate kinase [candidate division KSB1 bacterium]